MLGTYALATAALLTIAYVVGVRMQQWALARHLGTQPAPDALRPWWDVYGYVQLRELLAHDREKRVPEYWKQRSARLNAHLGRLVTTNRTRFAGSSGLFTYEPDNVKALLAQQFGDFALGKRRRGNFFPLLGNGIFTSDGHTWAHARAMLRPSFARDQVADLALEEKHCRNLHDALPVDPATAWTAPVDLQTLFFRLTIDSSTEFLFGESVLSQVRPDGERSFASAFDLAQDYLARRSRLGDRFWMLNPDEFQRACAECHAFIDYYVRRALDPAPKQQPSLDAKPKYIFLEQLANETKDPIELRSQLLHILLAGRDTTASLLGWVFYLLARHPQDYAELRRDVLDHFGTYEEPRNLSFAELKSCKSLQHVMNEALRLFPVVPINSRQAVKHTTLPVGGGPDGASPVFVPRGTVVTYSVFLMHRRKDIWGDDAEDFRPGRWVGRRPGWEFLPFNGGPRLCLGQQFALTSAGYCIVRMLQRFDQMQNLDTGVIGYNATLTMCSQNGVRVRLHQASL